MAPAAPGTSDPVLSSADTLDRVFNDALTVRGGAEAIVCGAVRLTYARIDRLADGLARALAARGVGPGTRVAMLAPPCPEVLILILACARLGATYMGLGTRLMTADFAFIFADARPAVVFAVRCYEGRSYLDDVRAACAQAGMAEPVFFGDADGKEVATDFLAFLKDADGMQTSLAGSRPEDVLAIIYTSGTTGAAKGVKIGHRAVIRSCRAFIRRSATGVVRSLSILPIDHIGFLTSDVVRPWLTGGAAIQLRKFDADAVIDAIERDRPTVWCAIPTMLQRLVQHPRFEVADLSSLDLVWWGGAIPGPVHDRARTKWRRLACGYGMTEASGGISLTPIDAGREELLATAGRPHDGMEVRIVQDPELEHGVGEVQLRSEYLMLGYLHAEHERDAFDGDWFRTGDLGRLVGRRLELVGRKKELIRSGGYNVSPAEIEAAILSDPAVIYAVVFGVPDADYGEAVNALWVPAPGVEVAESDVRARLRKKLSGFKVPKRFWRRESVAFLANNKVDRRAAIAEIRAEIEFVKRRSRKSE